MTFLESQFYSFQAFDLQGVLELEKVRLTDCSGPFRITYEMGVSALGMAPKIIFLGPAPFLQDQHLVGFLKVGAHDLPPFA